MDLNIAVPVLEAAVFGLVVAGIEGLIVGGITLRPWLARSWVYACFCFIILFGAIHL